MPWARKYEGAREFGGVQIVNCVVIWFEKTLGELTARESFGIFRLRSEVFVVEQDCVYLDMDDKDAQSIHLGAMLEDAAMGKAARAVVRLVPPGISYPEPSIGRVAIDLEARGSGLGVELMERAIRACNRHWPGCAIRISAQQYLVSFYERLGFAQVGEGYLEDGIPHIEMLCEWRGFEFYKDEWRAAREAFAESLESLPAESLQGTSEQWGGLQVLEHLRMSEAGFWRYLMKKCQAHPAELSKTDMASDFRGWQLIQALHSDRRWKDPTPGQALTPTGNLEAPLQAILVEWKAEQDHGFTSVQEVMNDADWWGVQVFNHPLAGRISLADAFGFGAAHIRHHLHQLNRLNSQTLAKS